jgi:hypothetical protein
MTYILYHSPDDITGVENATAKAAKVHHKPIIIFLSIGKQNNAKLMIFSEQADIPDTKRYNN